MKDRTQAARRGRGIAMLMVMVALVVCMVLVTGFLSTQGTANGIAKNEGEYMRAQRAAEDGAKMCVWLIKNKSSWRSTMTPGTWLNHYQIGGGTVTVTATDAGNNASFITDPTKAVIFQSTGTYNNRTAKLKLTAQPTGAGGVFGDGCFSSGQVKLENWAKVDSYSSKNGAYGFSNYGWSAQMGSASSSSGALTMADNADLYGSFITAPGAVLSVVLVTGGGTTGPFAVPTADEFRTPGQVIPPNMTGLASKPPYAGSGSGVTGPASGSFPSFTVTKSGTSTSIIFSSSGVYRVTGNMSLADACTISVSAGKSVVFEVDGNVTIGTGGIALGTGATCTIYYLGTFTATASTLGSNSANTTGLTILGLKGSSGSGGAMTLASGTKLYGSVFAPQSDVVMSSSSEVYGAIVSATLGMKDSSKLHWDSALATKVINNVTGGSAAPALPVYLLTYEWNN